MDKILSLKNISYSISGLEILKNINLDLHRGEYFAIAGINGAGKSTLMKLILDLIRPGPDGKIQIFDDDNQSKHSRDQLVYLPEKFDVRKNISGYQYLDFIASIYKQKISQKIYAELATRLDLSPDRLKDKIVSYSKGMVQKLGLVSCFMLQRPLLILDEPLSGLDPSARYHFKKLLSDEKSNQTTVLYSTHLLADAQELCDQFGILHQGEFKYLGQPSDCKTTFQAETLEDAYMKCICA